ncbi:hypothetical protein C2G38_2095138, partial [Gigaspora rosea]
MTNVYVFCLKMVFLSTFLGRFEFYYFLILSCLVNQISLTNILFFCNCRGKINLVTQIIFESCYRFGFG